MYEYIPDEFSRTWIASQDASRRGMYVPLAFIDILGGDRFAAEIFAQIMYWHMPDEKGKPRMSLVKDGFLWVAKNYREWFSECRIVYATARKAIETLIEQKLIFKSTEGFAGEKTPWLRVNWTEFRRRMTLWMQTSMDMLRQLEGKPVKDAEYRAAVKQYTEIPAPPVITEQGSDTISHPPDMTGQSPLLPQDDPNTETPEELKRIKDSAAASAAAHAVNFFMAIQRILANAIDEMQPEEKPKARAKTKPSVDDPEHWTRERQNEIFDTIARLSFDLPDPDAVRSNKGVGGRIGKCVAIVKARAPKITVRELEQFYTDYEDELDGIHAPQDDARFDTHFTAWWQKRQVRLLEKRRPARTRPAAGMGIGAMADMARNTTTTQEENHA